MPDGNFFSTGWTRRAAHQTVVAGIANPRSIAIAPSIRRPIHPYPFLPSQYLATTSSVGRSAVYFRSEVGARSSALVLQVRRRAAAVRTVRFRCVVSCRVALLADVASRRSLLGRERVTVTEPNCVAVSPSLPPSVRPSDRPSIS